jgi:hypothetical protein
VSLEPSGGWTRVPKFGEPPAAGANAGAGAAAAGNAEKPAQEAEPKAALTALPEPAQLEFRLSYPDAGRQDATQTVSRVVPVKLWNPRSYIEVIQPRFWPLAANREGVNKLSLEVATRARSLVPPSQVRLVVSRRDIPRLQADPKQTELIANLHGTEQQIPLFAADFPLAPFGDRSCVVYLDIDDNPRALKYAADFASFEHRQELTPDLKPAIREVRSGEVVLPENEPHPVLSEKPFPVTVEVDNPPPGSLLELVLRSPRGSGAPRRQTAAPKLRRLEVGTDPGGALLFRGAIEDPQLEFDIRGLRDVRILEARLVDERGESLCPSTVRELIFDDRAPEQLAIHLPAQVVKTGLPALDLEASGRSASGIASVKFFLGEPTSAGKAPDGAKLIEAQELDRAGRWRARVSFNGSEVGRKPVSVEMTNRVGKSAFKTEYITFVAPPPKEPEGEEEGKKPEEPKLGAISGMLKLDNLAQSKQVVRLFGPDATGAIKEKARTTTDQRGAFVFKDLQPGPYQLYAAKPTSKAKAQREVVVEAGKTAEVVLSLLR